MSGEMNRKLHAAATELVGKESAHEALHLIIQQPPFECESLSDLSNKQAEALLKGLEEQNRLRKKQVQSALGQQAFISQRQLDYVRDMKAQLNWSDEYFWDLLEQKYEHTEPLGRLLAFKAVRLVKMMKERVEKKVVGDR